MTLRPDQSADVSFDIEITQPDGALYGGGGHKNVTVGGHQVSLEETINLVK